MTARDDAAHVKGTAAPAALLLVASGCAQRTPGAGFCYQDNSVILPAGATARPFLEQKLR